MKQTWVVFSVLDSLGRVAWIVFTFFFLQLVNVISGETFYLVSTLYIDTDFYIFHPIQNDFIYSVRKRLI